MDQQVVSTMPQIHPHTIVGRFDGAILGKRLSLLENRGSTDILLIERFFGAVVGFTLSQDLVEVTELVCIAVCSFPESPTRYCHSKLALEDFTLYLKVKKESFSKQG
jgi:hypothetical protein